MTGILVENASKTFDLGDGQQKLALQGVNLKIEAGEFVCLLGPSGCGKTTLLNIMSGLDKAYRGQVRFTSPGAAAGIAFRQQRPEMGYVFQESRLLPWMTVHDNIRFVLDKGRHPEPDARRIEHWLARVGLAGHGRYYPSQLSIGMQQRVSVARALILEPELLFMDEPFSALDELTALRVRGELLGLWAEVGCTVVFVTHNPLEAVYLADRVIIMSPSPGHIAGELRPGGLLPRPRDIEDQRLWELSRQAVRKLMGQEERPDRVLPGRAG